jgi:subtilase family serine protease
MAAGRGSPRKIMVGIGDHVSYPADLDFFGTVRLCEVICRQLLRYPCGGGANHFPPFRVGETYALHQERSMRRALGTIPSLLFVTVCFAAQPDRITSTIDNYGPVVLKGSLYSKAQPQYDQGPVDAAMKLDYVTMVVQPSAKQQADLEQLLKQQQDPASSNYHRWLTPEQYADNFGLSPNDVTKITGWLRTQGFSIVEVARGRNWIAFSGPAVLVENTFRTQIHYFNVDGEQHFANATEILIPQALDGIVVGFRGLNDFSPKPMGIRLREPADFSSIIAQPFYTRSDGAHFLAPDDIATIYNITPLYSAGINGTGTKMVIVGQSDINITDINQFRSGFNLPAINLQQVLVGTDPGTTADLDEADLDIEWSGAVARNATIIYVNSKNAFTSAARAIDNTLAPVISMSFGGCEPINAPLGPAEAELQKANSEGITFLASSGDSGAAGCDGAVQDATQGLAVNYPASSPEVTGVGGNQFSGDVSNPSQYWNSSNNSNGESAISYIPEIAWNDTALRGTLSASGGGASSCNNTGCANGFSKPSWQIGTTPNDGVRDVPDVAISASPDHDGYIICNAGSCGSGIGSSPTIVGGTSASAPVFAGIVTLLNQFIGGTGLGNINAKLYQLAQNTSNGVFHDITTGNNIVPCTSGTPSGAPAALQCPKNGQFGYNAGPGYDQVTGLGSVDAHALVTNWGAPTTTTLISSSNPAPSNTSVTLTATVTTAGSTAPTGSVTFNDGATTIGTQPLASGKAALSTSTLSSGAHSITAAYSGDSKNAQSTSAVLIETITGTGTSPTTTTVVPNQGAVTYGTTATFNAAVTGTNPANTVTFLVDGTPAAFASVAGGAAMSPALSLTGGTHSITGFYSGDSTNASSTSSAVSQIVNQANSTTALSLNPAVVAAGSTGSVTMTVTVAPASGSGTPTGSVDFFADGVPIRQPPATLSNGAATFKYTPSALTGGNHSITANYLGDANFGASFSTGQTLSVQDFQIAANPATVSISSPGQSGTTTLTITPLGGFNQTLSYSCGTVPSETNCTFASAGTNSETLTISSTAASRLWEGPFGHRGTVFYALLFPGLMGLVLPSGKRKRSWRRLLPVLVVLGALILWIPGCGGSGSGGGNHNPGTPTGSSMVTITASTSGGSLSHSVNITLNIQ